MRDRPQINGFRRGVPILLLLLSCLVSCGQSHTERPDIPKVVQGVLDLQDWDFEQHGSVMLNGEWEWY